MSSVHAKPSEVRFGGSMTTCPSLHPSSTFSHERIVTEAQQDDSLVKDKAVTQMSPDEDPIKNWHLYFSRKSILGDGDCLFSTVADCLTAMPPHLLSKVQDRLTGAGIATITVEDLKEADMVRALSVSNIFRETDRMKSLIKDWRYIYAMGKKEKDRDLMRDYGHMACIEHVTDEELSEAHLKILYSSMRQKGTYWGTEFDLINLEYFLGMRFIVIDHLGKVQTIPSDHPESWSPSIFCLMYRRQIRPQDPPHFQVLQWNENERRSFLPEELPPMVIEMCRKALPSTTSRVLPWYIRMDMDKRP